MSFVSYRNALARFVRVSVPEAYRVPTVVNAINPAEIEDLIDSRLDVRLASLRLELLAEVEGKLAA